MKTHRAKKSRFFCVMTLVTVMAAFVFTAPRPARAAGLLIADGGFGGVLQILEHDVRVTVNNGVAVTEVTQVFCNTEDRQVEALYTFPVPKGASVSNFSMWIGGKEIIGEVLEKGRAREIYESYKQTRRDPGLLEQVDYKTFEMRIFPIGPQAKQKVQIAYYQELDFDHDWATYVYPLATVSRKGVDSTVSGHFSLNLAVKSPVPIIAMESPSHGKEFLTVKHTDMFREAGLEKQEGDLNRDVVLAYKISRPLTGMDLIASNQAGEDGYFCLTLMAGEELAKTDEGGDYVFILDVSGSMMNDLKLETSRKSVEAYVEALGPTDRFEIITFNLRPATLFNQLQQVDETTRQRAVAHLRTQEARGGTALKPALDTAYKYADPDRPLNVVILSDGMTEQKSRQVLIQTVRARPANVRVFCIGVGNEVNRPLLEQIARDAGGLASFVSRGDNFERQAKAFRRKLLHPVATDMRISIGGVNAYDLEPKKMPNLYYGMPVRVYGRYKGSGMGQVNLEATVRGRPVKTAAELEFPAKDDRNPEIERMWAWKRLRKLQDGADARLVKDKGTLAEIVRLGEAYSIASEYTSFIVLENDAEYKRWKIERRNALRIERDRKAQSRLREELDALRSKSLSNLGPVNPERQKPKEIAQAQPNRTNTAPNNRRPVRIPSTNPPRNRRSSDLPSFGGGGALDPVSASIALALGGSAFLAERRRRKRR